ncbi:MAG: amidohydrolase family protein [Gemmatimonadetes bacterium]|nr:amidohydrolase family protein [Gemmatimonadota bacterium]
MMRRFLWGAAFAAAPVAGAQAPVVITNTSIVDVETGRVRAGQSIRVEGNRIREIGPTGQLRVPAGARVVDGTGRFVIPGLWDMHVHATGFGIDRLFQPVLVANGVTGMRDMWGQLAAADSMRAAIARGEVVGPRTVISGHILDAAPAIWPGSLGIKGADAARRAVDSLAKAGAAFIKVYSRLNEEEFRAAGEQAKRNGLHFAGHVPSLVTVDEAVAQGMRTIEHLQQFTTACSSREAELRQQYRDAVASPKSWDSAAVMGRAQLSIQVETFDAARCAALATRVARSETWLVPTFTVLRSVAYLDDSTLKQDPRLAYIPKFFSASWDPKQDFRFRAITPQGWADRKRIYARQLEIGRLMHRAGVKFLAGTDLSNPWIFPGSSLHDELAHFVAIGMTPLQALQTATLNPARFYAAVDSMGTVGVNKVADLVVLDGNPLVDIRNVTRVFAVVANGRLIDPQQRAALLKDAEARAK